MWLLLSVYVAYGAWLFMRDLRDFDFLVDTHIDKNNPKISPATQRWILLFCCFFGIALAWPLIYLVKD